MMRWGSGRLSGLNTSDFIEVVLKLAAVYNEKGWVD
jgi:hypothetical protein